MPRLTELQGYRFAARDIEIPITDERGNVTFDINTGQPKLQKVKEVIAFDQLGDVVKFILTDEARRELIGLLTGGVIVPEIEVVQQ